MVKIGGDKIKQAFLDLLGIVLVLVVTMKAEAIEPRLLWEKTVPFKIDDIKMAAQSGDIILYSQKAKQIIIYDKTGNERFHWGPRIDRRPMGLDISDDGNTVLFETVLTERFALENKAGGYDKRIHCATRNGKELKRTLGTLVLTVHNYI